VDFENRARLFPDVDSRMKFSLLTLGRDEDTARFAFFLTDPAQLAEPERNFTLSPEQIAAINPNTKTAPVFRSRVDAELMAKIYGSSAPMVDLALGEQIGQRGNPWNLDVHSRFIHVTEDSGRFRSFSELASVGRVYTSHAMAPFARDLGHSGPPFAWDENRRANLRADLDAFYARAYGLDRDELRFILDPADVKGPNYPSETFRVLKEKEVRQFGEYRTRRLVLEAWDRMEADGTFVALGFGGVSGALAVPAIVGLPPLEGLLNGVWAWPASTQPQDRLRYAAQYALWQMDPAIDGTRIRFVIASLAEPALLTPLLDASDRVQWVRLVGSEAQSAQGIVRLRPAINTAWRSMFETLLTSGQLEERADGMWTRGQHFSSTGLQAASADAQRAAFAIRAVRSMDVGSLTAAAAAPEDNVIWARFGNGRSG